MTRKQVLASKYIVMRGFDKEDHPPITYQDVEEAFMFGFDDCRVKILGVVASIGEDELDEHGKST